MAQLHNKISKQELKDKLKEDNTPRLTISFYKYFKIQSPKELRDQLFKDLSEMGIMGRIYLAEEGINAQISVPEENQNKFKDYLYAIDELDQVRLNIAVEDDGKSFFVLKIKVRKKIVADGIEDENFDPAKTGIYLKAAEYNKMVEDDNTVVVDMRNHYEYEVGHFENAIEIPSDTFRDQLPMAEEMLEDKKDKNIIMYCTGGIRCEKASAYLKYKGFENVYHVEGGIINYTKNAREQNLPLKFIGKNFVFDERLGERITEDVISECHQCGQASDDHTNCKNQACHLLFIQCPTCAEEMLGCCTDECKSIVKLPEEEQQKLRSGVDKGRMIFNKSKDVLSKRFKKK